jgi:VanZ family protein
MQRSIKKLFKDKKKRIFIAVLITASIAVLSLIKLGKLPVSINNIDKIQHMIAYFFLTLSWLVALGTNKKSLYIIVLSCVFYGVLMEVLQVKITTYRAGEYYDILANILGVLLAFTLFRYFFYKKHII